MKNVINILAAVILLASCTKTEVTYDAPSEIAFAPVEKNVTKADADAQYYNGPGFYVFAAAGNIPYFNNVYFKQSGSEYVGSTTQYWPNKTNLKFAGYTSNASNPPDATYESDVLTLTDYTQDINHDLMWFFTGDVERNTDAIEPLMMHACSKITIVVEGEQPCANWPITKMTLNGVSTSGNVTFTASKAAWSSLGEGGDIELFSGSKKISEFGSVQAIVIPQDPVTLTVGYNGKTTNPAISLEYNGDNAWEAGKHYTYTLNFKNPHKIEFGVSGVSEWVSDLNGNDKADDTITIQ